MKISIIACVGKNLELGKNNDLIWHIKEDLKYFKDITNGNMVVMGKNTFKSLPGVLKNRKNIVLTTSNEDFGEEVEIFSSKEKFLEKYKNYPEEIFIIGGARVYQEFLEYADALYLTEVDKESDQADVYFPKFDKALYEKEIIKKSKTDDINYQFTIYRRK